MRKYHQRLIYVAIGFFLLSLLNAFQFFLGGGEDFRKLKGEVRGVEKDQYFGHTKYTRNTYYARTSFRLAGHDQTFYTVEDGGEDSLLMQLQHGDRVELYTKRWYHYISYFGMEGNLYFLKKDGRVIYDVRHRSRHLNKIFMIIAGVIGLFFTVVWLDVVKKVSLENWFQRKILLNPDYIRRHRDRQEP